MAVSGRFPHSLTALTTPCRHKLARTLSHLRHQWLPTVVSSWMPDVIGLMSCTVQLIAVLRYLIAIAASLVVHMRYYQTNTNAYNTLTMRMAVLMVNSPYSLFGELRVTTLK